MKQELAPEASEALRKSRSAPSCVTGQHTRITRPRSSVHPVNQHRENTWRASFHQGLRSGRSAGPHCQSLYSHHNCSHSIQDTLRMNSLNTKYIKTKNSLLTKLSKMILFSSLLGLSFLAAL